MRGLLSPLIRLVLFLVITSLATYGLAVTITNSQGGSTQTYRAEFHDVTGLELGDDVRIAGVRVGSITGIKVSRQNTDPNCPQSNQGSCALISFTVLKSHGLARSTVARLRYRNLVGQRYLAVEQGTGDPTLLKRNGVIPLSQTQDALDLTVLFNGFQPLFQGLDAGEINQLSQEIIQVLQGEGGTVSLLLGQVADLTNTIADKDAVIGDLITNLGSLLTSVSQRDGQLTDLIDKLQVFVSGLAQDRVAIGNSIVGINQLASATTQLLVNVRPPLAKDVTSLEKLAANLNAANGEVTGVIQRLPGKLGALIRTASYGSFFNFYLCTAGVSLSAGGTPITLPSTPASGAPRCTQ